METGNTSSNASMRERYSQLLSRIATTLGEQPDDWTPTPREQEPAHDSRTHPSHLALESALFGSMYKPRRSD